MRQLFSLRYYAVCLMLEYLFFQVMTSLALGSFESVSEAKCEYEDANLIWRKTPAYTLNDVKAMAWYKEKDSLIATWLEGNVFKEYPPYIGRLMQIGETGIKLQTVNRSDSGSYWLSLTLASTDHKLEAATHLVVIVAPSSQCKPTITEEGSILKAELPAEGCGTPPLTPKWKSTSKTVIQELQTPSLLDLGNSYESGEYVVCAEGDSAMCYHGNISDLCTVHTKSRHEGRDVGLPPDLVSIVLPIVLVSLIVVVVSILAVIWWKRKFCCGNILSEGLCWTVEGKPTNNAEEYPLIEEETSRKAEACTQDKEYPLTEKDFPAIQNYLCALYKSMNSVSVSPTGKENFVGVLEVYIDLDFQEMDIRDFKYTENDLASTSYNTSVSKEDIPSVKEHRRHISPIIIVGCSGSGKSTWCKHLIQCWSQNSKIEEANVQGINLSSLGEYEILLYLQLKSSDRGLSFQELLRHNLFKEQPEYLNIITKYMDDKIHAQSILILIDGLDKIGENVNPMSDLLDPKLFSSCTVVFTCRPGSFKPIIDASIDSSIQLKLFKVCEMPLEKSMTYVGKVLSRLYQHNKDFNVKNFLTFTRNLHVQSLLKLPYLCLTLLFVWMENKNPYIEITDILLRIIEHLLDSAKTDQWCAGKITKLLEMYSHDVHTSVNKLDDRFSQIKDLMYELSMTADAIFVLKTKGLTDKECRVLETSAIRKDTLHLEVLYETGLITEFSPSKSNESLSKLTFTNVLMYQLFVSMAIAFKNGQALDYFVSDMEVALKNSMIIHMLWQFSPTLGKEIFVNIRKLKSNKLENMGKHNDKFRCSITKRRKRSKVNKFREESWLQLLMYKGDLDDDKLLFLTNALRSMDSLASLVLEDIENNDDLVFWLPCSPTLKKLKLNISNCTLLLCPEWNNQAPIKLKTVVIKSVIISNRDLEVLCKVFKSCKLIKKQEMSPTVLNTGDNEILS